MDHGGRDHLDDLLQAYDRRKQEETRHLVAKARRLEEERQKGADLLRQFVVPYVRRSAGRIEEAGHQVAVDEMLDAYPPGVRLHTWVKPGPLEEAGASPRFTLEFVWGDPHDEMMCVKRWSSAGLDKLAHQGQCRPGVLDSTWVLEQIHVYVGHALSP